MEAENSRLRFHNIHSAFAGPLQWQVLGEFVRLRRFHYPQHRTSGFKACASIDRCLPEEAYLDTRLI